MLATRDPFSAYRSVAFEAQVAGSRPGELVLLCIEDVSAAISRAVWAQARDQAAVRRSSLQRAANGLAALQLGVDRDSPLADGLLTLYSAMARCVTASLSQFDTGSLARVVQDLHDLAEQFRANLA
ncbi:flagellar protein FliS [Erythrobacter sp. EC-HK427]|uniref:flagellar protein FliS n=1 Tax=Erythrobacter sp. EC-HK427 TaxID=2038396 RepID=UPI0012514335|nr:flagellar protein FliS [Erythrobacter sp. EC-HK427]VVT01751.1 putative Flagellin [Erythrobacter sp. EC-HK427]